MDYLIDHWSVSAVAEFIRNEKSFERKYIFRDIEKTMSVSQIIGNTYHSVLMKFFEQYQVFKTKMSYDEMCMIAHLALNTIGANQYRAQKTLTIEQQQQEALKYTNQALKAFLEEFDVYAKEIKEILFIEKSFKTLVEINGVAIPIPLKIKPDIVFIDYNDELCILDHKAKKNWSNENDINIRYGNQTIGYTLGINAAIKEMKGLIKDFPKAKEGVKHFYFYENKFVKNRNGARQIKQIPINIEKTGPLLEQLLFEGVFRMVEAVGNPDYVYLINPADHYQDSSEILDFWMKTHIEGLEGFPNLKPKARKMLAKKRSMIRRSALTGIPKSIVKSFSQPKDFITFTQKDMENLSIEERIEHRLRVFNYMVKVEHKIEGYSCDTYLLKIPAGVKISSIYNYRMDIANAVGVSDVRISNNLIEYKNDIYIAVEVNRKEHRFLNLSNSDIGQNLEIPLGKDNFGKTIYWDVGNPSTPHVMIAGSSGSGKSVAIKTIIAVAKKKGLNITILDPKREFLDYANEFLVLNEIEDIEDFMRAMVSEMDRIFREHGAIGNSENKHLIIFDESADCFARQNRSQEEPEDFEFWEKEDQKQWKMQAKKWKTLEENTLILSQKARSAGIHLILAAQRFSVKVLTGDAKANFSTRLCLTVASGVDSKVMLDVEGAEKLNGKGDALVLAPGLSEPVRIQCFSTN